MKTLTSCCHASPFLFLFLFALTGLICSCAPKQENGTSTALMEQNNALERVNKKLVKDLEHQKQLTAQLQMCLLGKYAEVDRLMASQEHFVNEFGYNKAKSWNRGDKVETVRFVAEVTTVIDTVKETPLTESRKGVLFQAEEYLAKSNIVLAEGDFDAAWSLAELALKQVQTVQLELVTDGLLQDDLVINFATPLPMRLLTSGNVREAPSMAGRVKSILERGSHVIAVGYKGQWVKVKLTEQDHGWVHYSLLNGALE